MKSIVLVGGSVLALVLAAGSAQADDVRVIVGFKGGRVATASLPAAAAARLRADPDVAYVEEDGIAEVAGRPDSAGKPGGGGGTPTPPPPQTTPWGVAKVDTATAWVSGKGDGVDVAVIDTGIDLDHPDLAANVGSGIDYVSPGTTPDDDNGHGSHVAGTIAAVDNDRGYIGVAPDATIHPVKVLDRRGSGWLSDVAAGIDWARTNSIDVINMSLGSSQSATTLQTACDAASAAGVLVIAAAGNSGDNQISTSETSYPAAYGSVVSVGATASNDALASFSNTNSDVEVSGPGVNVPSTSKNAGYATYSGTSMASPHAAGVAALLLSTGSTAATVRADLQGKAYDLGATGRDNGFGFGRLDWTPTTP